MIDFTLMKHQKEAIFRAETEPDLFIAHEMGTGKSCTTIQILRNKYSDSGKLMKTLIIAPKIVLSNWKKEFELFSRLPKECVYTLSGPIKKRTLFFKQMKNYSFVGVINYDAMQDKELCEAIYDWGPDILVCDESHNVKNYQSKRAKHIAAIADKCKHRYLLTGTPILNNALDLFMQYRILDGYLGNKSTFGHNFFVFRSRFFVDANASWNSKPGHFPKWEPRAGAYQDLMQLISKKTLRAEKKDCLDLPPLVTQKIEVEMSPEQRRAYEEMKKNFITYVESDAVVAQLAITKTLRMQQIVSGFVKTDKGEVVRFKKNPRLEALKELLELLTPNHKVIVWACFKENYAMIRELCSELGVKYVEVHGDIGGRDRDEAIKLFNGDPSVRVFISCQGAGGVGINLVSSSYSIYYSRGFKLGDDIQSEARNHRKGSEIHEKITRINLVANETIDELISDALAYKLDLGNMFLDYLKKQGKRYGF